MNKKERDQSIARTSKEFKEGMHAKTNRCMPSSNPYPEGSEQSQDWMMGYAFAATVIARLPQILLCIADLDEEVITEVFTDYISHERESGEISIVNEVTDRQLGLILNLINTIRGR